ncbi:MAG: sensor histidine kinase [Chlorobia bacterium]|nr:sensor histidine kinase [Fimbriimonadaceae bacterium]
MGSGSKKRHLIFLIHLWVCTPFALFWVDMPEVRRNLTDASAQNLWYCIIGVFIYLGGRTILAFRNPSWLKWDFVYPPVDVAIVSMFLYFADSNPLSNIALLYFLPIAEAAQTLNWRWSATVAFLVIAGSILASLSTPIEEWTPFNIAFRFFFLIVMSSLLTALAKQAAEIRSQLRVEADRNRLALEMHDGLQGSLITAASQMELVQMVAKQDPERAAQLAGESRQTVRQATDELRFLVQRLRKHEMVGGFEPALRQYSSNICERNGLGLEFDVEGPLVRLDAESENALFRIAQEALNNVLRHAKAKNVTIKLRFWKDRTELYVMDDGIGFAPDPSQSHVDHAGLDGMKMRAEECNGQFKIRALEIGTVVEVSIPKR